MRHLVLGFVCGWLLMRWCLERRPVQPATLEQSWQFMHEQDIDPSR